MSKIGKVLSTELENIQKMTGVETPYYLYDEVKLRENCQRFRAAFSQVFPRFQPLFAVKTNSNPHLLSIIQSEGFGFDCSSPTEILLAQMLAADGMFTSNYLRVEDILPVRETKLILNLDDGLEQHPGIYVPEKLSFRVNLGTKVSDFALSGVESKFGIPEDRIAAAYTDAKSRGVREFGIHTMIGSNVLDAGSYEWAFANLLDCVGMIQREAGIQIGRINIGGGFGFPYENQSSPLDLFALARSLRAIFEAKKDECQLTEPILMAEPGRIIIADTGVLIARVTRIKNSYKKFIGLDVSSNSMPRPAWFGAEHRISILSDQEEEVVSVVGSICDNSDQFAKDRRLPKCEINDFVAIHDCGAYGYSQSNQFCGHARPGEYLVASDGKVHLIRKREAGKDLFGLCQYDKELSEVIALRQLVREQKNYSKDDAG